MNPLSISIVQMAIGFDKNKFILITIILVNIAVNTYI